jgi:hypothetical protein
MVCRSVRQLKDFVISKAAWAAGQASAKTWKQALKKKGLPFTSGDEANVASACAVVEEFALRLEERGCAALGAA